MSTKNAILRASVEGQIVELLVKSNVKNIYMEDGTTLLSTELANILTTLGQKANSADVTTEINAAIDALIDGAPDTYNTLKEIADYLTTHQNEYTALVQTVAGKVDKVEGKGLSTNDFTNALLSKLNGISEGAQVNVIEKITVNGAEQAVTGKTVNVTVPTGALASKSSVSESDLDSALAEKVNASAEGNHAHANKAVLDTITTDKVSAWDAAEQNAKDYADTLDTAMDTRVDAVEADVATLKTKGDVYVTASQPASLKEGDLWIQLV